MGADYYATTVIGIRVGRSEIFKKRKTVINCCRCKQKTDPRTAPNTSFCPFCGKPLQLEVEKEFCIISDVDDERYIENVRGWPVRYDTDQENIFIGVYVNGPIDGWKIGPLPDLSEDLLDKFTQDMRELGLWRQDRFGLWTILVCSY